MSNAHSGRAAATSGSATDLMPIVPDDLADLPTTATALYVEVGGDVAFVSLRGATRTVAVADMTILPVQVRRVLASGTTAGGLHAFTIGAA